MVWLSRFIWWCFKEYSRLEPARESRRYFRSVPTIWQVFSVPGVHWREEVGVWRHQRRPPGRGKTCMGPGWRPWVTHTALGCKDPMTHVKLQYLESTWGVKVLKAANVCRERSGTPGRVLHLGLTDGANLAGRSSSCDGPVFPWGKNHRRKNTLGSWDILGRFSSTPTFNGLYHPIWVWVNTYTYHFSGMNIHLPAILMSTRGTRFWPIPHTNSDFWRWFIIVLNHINQVLITINH